MSYRMDYAQNEKFEIVTIPAQPGYFLLLLGDFATGERPMVCSREPIIAWQIHTSYHNYDDKFRGRITKRVEMHVVVIPVTIDGSESCSNTMGVLSPVFEVKDPVGCATYPNIDIWIDTVVADRIEDEKRKAVKSGDSGGSPMYVKE